MFGVPDRERSPGIHRAGSTGEEHLPQSPGTVPPRFVDPAPCPSSGRPRVGAPLPIVRRIELGAGGLKIIDPLPALRGGWTTPPPLGGEPALTPWWEERPLRDDGAPVDLREGARVTRRWQPLPELTENGAL